jgi:hypothetical protein
MLNAAEVRTRTCPQLRWKSMFFATGEEAGLPENHDGFCWCTRTMTCLGPDGKVANQESCSSERGCFEQI